MKTELEKLMEEHDVHLMRLLKNEEKGFLTGKPSLDKPHLKYYPEEALYQELPKASMYNYMYELNKDHLDDVAIIFDTGFDETPITYRKLFKNIDKVANNLRKKGIRRQDKVAVSMPNIPESVYTVYALNKIGAVACLIDPRITPYNLEKDLEDLDVKMYIGIAETYKNVNKIQKKLNLDKIIITPSIRSASNRKIKMMYMASKLLDGSQPIKLNKNYSIALAKNSIIKEQYEAPYKEDSVAFISYTGGTTGVHKGVMQTNDAINSMVFSHNYVQGDIERGAKFMSLIPPFLIYGIFTLHLALCRGFETHMLMDSSPEHFVDYLIKINPTLAFGGPIHWETLIDNPKITENCFSNMRSPVSGGEKLSLVKEKEISEALLKGGSQISLCNGYGASELCGSVTLKEGSKSKDGTIGKLHVYDNIRIVDIVTKEELGYNQEGEVQISSPSLMKGYYNNPEETENAIVIDSDGTRWFTSGDLGYIDENADITLTGRSKRLFVCGVNNVYPPQIEELIYQVPTIKECVVVNVPDEELREVPKVHFSLIENSEENVEKTITAIEALISERISDEVLPHYYEVHDHLMRTLSGKIDFEGHRKQDLALMENKKQPKVLVKN